MESSTPRPRVIHSQVAAATTRDLPIYDSSRARLPLVEDAVELLRYRDLLWSLVE